MGLRRGGAVMPLVLVALAGCLDAEREWRVGSCDLPQEKGPLLVPLPAFAGDPPHLAQRFANAIGRELGPYGPAPPGISAGPGWRVGGGHLVVFNESAADTMRGQIRYASTGWPGHDVETVEANLRSLLAAFGVPGDDVELTRESSLRFDLHQATPAGPLWSGWTEKTSEWVRFYFSRHYAIPERVGVDAEAAARLAETFEYCRKTRDSTPTAQPRAPSEVTVDGKATVVEERLAYEVELRFGEGTPGGFAYHGCPPPRTWVFIDAQTGTVLKWDDTYICE